MPDRYLKYRIICCSILSLLICSTFCASQILEVAADSDQSVLNRSDGRDRDGDSDDDACQKLIKTNGHGEGLQRRCGVAGTGGGVAKGDFNGDGDGDLAIGVPYEDQDGVNAVGGVNIIYGGFSGLTSAGNQFVDERTFGIALGSDDHFGWSLASGDFNRDGFSDLAVGMPDWDLVQPALRISDVGRVLIVSGSANGLNFSTVRSLGSLLQGRAGAALVWADFNGDGFGDLAVGVPEANVKTFVGDNLFCIGFNTTVLDAGSVQVYYGGSNGLKETGITTIREGKRCINSNGDGAYLVGDDPQEDDNFGSVLTAGDYSGGISTVEPRADLVIGVPFKDVGSNHIRDAGMVYLIFGTVNGVRGNVIGLSQSTSGVQGTAEEGDQFGRSLAMGDLNFDDNDDLIIGVPFEDINSAINAGAIQIFFGTEFLPATSVVVDGNLFISQAHLPGVALESGDQFGWSVAVGDFNSNDAKDIAVGSPGEDIGSVADAGMVIVIYSSRLSGPVLTNTQNWTQNSAGLLSDGNGAETGDQFGYSLSAWNFGASPAADLAIGVPYEDIRGSDGSQIIDAGAVNLIFGRIGGLNAENQQFYPPGNQFWTQDSSGIRDSAQNGDRFGLSLY